MFQIQESTEATLTAVTNRVEKHGDEDVPAVSLQVSIETANTLLDSIDPTLRGALYTPKPDAEPELDGVEPSTPVLRCNSVDRMTLTTKHEGWTLAIDAGIEGDVEPMTFGGVKVDKLSVEPKQGGSIVLRMRLVTSDVDADKLGWLGMHNGEAIWIKLTPPKKAPDAIDGSNEAFTKDHPDATDLFAAEHAETEEDEDAGPELEDRLDNALRAADAETCDSVQVGDSSKLSGAASKAALDASGKNPFGRRGRRAAAEVE